MSGILLVSVAASLLAASASDPRPGPIAVVDVTVAGREEVQALVAGGYDIGNVRGNVVTVYATAGELRTLTSNGYSFAVTGRQPHGGVKAPAGYRSYDALTGELEDRAAAHPAICRLSTLGASVEGRELWAMLITANPDDEEDEPEFKYVSTMHGDEPLGTELCLDLIALLLDEYGTNTRITDLVDTTAIWIVPLMNPDGYENGARLNAGGYDLNRSFPAYGTGFFGTIFDGEPLHAANRPIEAAHVMRWIARNSFTLSANFHTGALVANYPYDDDGLPSGAYAPTPDDALFADVSRRYSFHNAPMWESAFFTDGITNGGEWYVASGSMQDWNYRYASCNEVTIELSDVKVPRASQIDAFWADNEESMLSYMEAVHVGVRGVVTDLDTGAPLWAEVGVQGNGHPVFTDPEVGDYHRMLLPGTYTLTYSAPGHETLTETDVEVDEGTAIRVDVELAKAGDNGSDVNVDGVVDAVDVQIVVNAVLGAEVAYDCDVDGGGLSATDVQTVINVLLHRT